MSLDQTLALNKAKILQFVMVYRAISSKKLYLKMPAYGTS